MSFNCFRAGISAFAVVATIAIAAPASAQQAGLQINVVQEDGGAPVAGAKVTIENKEIGFRRSETTDDFGRVRLEALTTSGTYIVSVAANDGYNSAAAAPVSLRSNFTGSVTIRVGGQADNDIGNDIVVTGRAVTGINTVNAEISSSLPRDALVALPIEGRDVIQALIRLPNVVASTGFFPEAPVEIGRASCRDRVLVAV